MTTLHIEHPIVDFDLWSSAFARFADARQQAGVRAQRVSRPVDDDHYVVIDLEFDGRDSAERFLGFLQTQVWPRKESAPALVGTPKTVILDWPTDVSTLLAGAEPR